MKQSIFGIKIISFNVSH